MDERPDHLDEALDASLGRLFDPPEVRARYVKGAAMRMQRPMRRKLAVAAAIASGIIGLGLLFDGISQRIRSAPPPPPTLVQAYVAEVSSGFKEKWRCENDAEFIKSFEDRLGQGLVLRNVPAVVVAKGLDYTNSLSPRTLYMLAEVDGERVLVFVDRLESDSERATVPDERLNIFRRTVDDLVLYEVTPLDEATVLPCFVNPAKIENG